MASLGMKAFGGLFKLIFILFVLLFVPAWSLLFWQAWVLLAVIFTATLGITVSLLKNDRELLKRRLRAGPESEKEPIQKWLQAVAYPFFCGLFVVAGLDWRLHWSSVPLWVVVSGNLGVMLGFFIVFRVFRVNTFTSGIIEVDTGQTVVTTGPYACVRHPMYAGGTLLLSATPLALGSCWALLCLIPLLAVLAARLLHEERYLSEHLDGYSAYCATVRYRLLPEIW
jgi:protein-S-isoprenylcysteine O-methyltransferase Ste14